MRSGIGPTKAGEEPVYKLFLLSTLVQPYFVTADLTSENKSRLQVRSLLAWGKEDLVRLRGRKE